MPQNEEFTRQLVEIKADVKAALEKANEATSMVKKTQEDIALLLQIFTTIRGGVTFFVGFVTVLKWFAGTAVTVSAIWALIAAFKTGKLPGIP